MTFWQTVGRGLRLRCPRCGQGKLFKGLFAMADACSSCGLDFRREQGYYIGAMYINYGATAVILLGVSLPLIGKYPLPTILWPLGLFCSIFPIWFFRYSRSLWLALDLYIITKIPK
ncbi:MAG TPA: DUF983 domain-containing protein [Planctomycetota bacterium]|nr:DUF983 domain-containing protein [Planctomycetota bacterium]